MSVKMTVKYQGSKHCELTHGPSGTVIQTDAPKDNQGKGESFSPTDLLGAALASCVLTTMAIVCERDGFSIEGATAEIEKIMASNPRRVAELPLRVTLPAGLTSEQRRLMENTARACPVEKSLHPDIKRNISFVYV